MASTPQQPQEQVPLLVVAVYAQWCVNMVYAMCTRTLNKDHKYGVAPHSFLLLSSTTTLTATPTISCIVWHWSHVEFSVYK